MNKPRVLITGAAGFQAAFIVRRLRENYDLTLFDRHAPQPEFAALPFLCGDITNLADVERACEGHDAVIHLVALVRERHQMPLDAYCEVMVKGTWNVAEACARQKVRRLVNISSVVAAGWPTTQQQAYRVEEPPSFVAGDLFYCLAKSLGETIGNAYHQAHGLEVIHLRPGMIARDGANIEPEAMNRESPFWFMHVDPADVAQAVEAALSSETKLGAFQIVAGREDALFDWRAAAQQIGYAPTHNWPEIPVGAQEKP